MIFSVHHNSLQMRVQSGIRRNISGLTRTLERLSTGKRINSPKDDPSGFIATQLIRSDIAKDKAVIASNQRESSRLATIESGLARIGALLTQARSYVLAAANTGALTGEEIAAYQTQLDGTIDAIHRMTRITSFQGRSVLEGLEGLLNGTLTVEQSAQVLGMPYITSSGKVDTESDKNAVTLGELAETLSCSLELVDAVHAEGAKGAAQTDRTENGQRETKTTEEDFVTENTAAGTTSPEFQFLQRHAPDLVDSRAGDSDTLLEIVAQKEAERRQEEQERLRQEAEDARVALEEEARLEEERERQKAFDAQIEAQKQKAHELYFAKVRNEYVPEEAPGESRSRRDLVLEDITTLIGDVLENPGGRGFASRPDDPANAALFGLFPPKLPNVVSNDTSKSDPGNGFGPVAPKISKNDAATPAAGDSPGNESNNNIACNDDACNDRDRRENNIAAEKDERATEESKESESPTVGSLEDLRSGGAADLKSDPEAADKILKALIGDIAFSRAVVGVNRKSLAVDNALATDRIYHATELDALISDADYAVEASNLARYQILLQSSTKMLQIAQELPKLILKMIETA